MKKTVSKTDIEMIGQGFKITGIVLLVLVGINIIMFFVINDMYNVDFGGSSYFQFKAREAIKQIEGIYAGFRIFLLGFLVFWFYYFVLFQIAKHKFRKSING